MTNKKKQIGERLKFKAVITHCRWYSEDNHWGIFEFTTSDNVSHKLLSVDDFYGDDKKFGEIVGNIQKLEVGNEYILEVEVEYNKKYQKDQFKPIKASMDLPTSKDQQERFLNSLLTKNQCDALLSVYPNIVQDVIENKPIDVSLLHGIGDTTILSIKQKIVDNYIIIDLLSMLSPYGITYNQIKKISELNDNPMLVKKRIEENPYVLTEIKGFGFKKVDGIALKINKEMRLSKFRAKEYIKHVLSEESESVGHTWVKRDYLISKARKDINECMDLIKLIIDEEESNPSFLMVESNRIGLLVNYRTEKAILRELDRINNAKSLIELPNKDEVKRIISLIEERQGFKLSDEQRLTVESISNSGNVVIVSGLSGCVDCDTEYFNGTEWVRIADYKIGDKVLQFNEDRTATLTIPNKYIKQPCETMWHIKKHNGSIDQVLSDEHRVVYETSKGNLGIKTMFELVKINKNSKNGFTGKFLSTFSYNGDGIDLTDAEIRVAVATMADGHFPNKNTNRCRFNIKKERKQIRLRELFREANIQWEEHNWNPKDPQYINFIANVPLVEKEFSSMWYNCTQHQLEIVLDEIMFWDSHIDAKGRRSFSTVSKQSADFVQFVASACGYNSNISTYNRVGKKYKTAGKMYNRKSIEYDVHICKNKDLKLSLYQRQDSKLEYPIKPYKTIDGYKYCFSVDSGMLVLRRNNRIFITGNSGKTSSVKAIYSILENSKVHGSELKPSVLQIALSAKASKRINEVTNRPSMTMHRALGFDGKKFKKNEQSPLQQDIILLDEFSMVNIQLTLSLLKAVKSGAMLFLVFDHAQLPAIGAGSVAYDLLEYPKYNTSKYTQVHRQAEKSGILCDANKIRQQKSPIKQFEKTITTGELKDMTYFFRKTQEEINELVIKYYLSGVEKYGVDGINIVTARKDKVLNSAESLNKTIQDHINPRVEGQYIENNYKTIDFRVNDRVIHKVNDKERNVYNGDTGVVVEITRDYVGQSMQDIMIVDYGMEYDDDGNELNRKLVVYTKSDLDDIRLAYALTTHSFQGSENKAIIVVLDSSAYTLLDCTMLYTAITRAKERCLLISDPNSFNTCIRTNKTVVRNTYLKEMLKESINQKGEN